MRAPLFGLLVALLVAGAWGVHRSLWLITPVEVAELQSLDWRFRLRGPLPTQEEIVLLAVDDRTMAEAPRVFERRAGQAEMIRAAKQAGAAVVAVDLLFHKPEHLLDAGLIRDIDDTLQGGGEASPERALLVRVGEEVHGDDQLVAALKESQAILALHVGARGDVPRADKYLSRGRYGQVVPGPWLPARSGRILASDPMFTRAARRMGVITTFQDLTGQVREVPLALRVQEDVYVPMAVQILAARDGVRRGNLAFLGTEGVAALGDQRIRGEAGRLRLNWRGQGAFRTISVVDLLTGAVPDDALRGRIAIIGYSHLAQDAANTPFGTVPGMEVHATALDNLLGGDGIRRAGPAIDGLWTLLCGVVVSLCFWMPRRWGQTVPVLASGWVLAAFVGVSAWLFASRALWVSLVGPVASGGLAMGACVASAWLEEGVQRRFLRRSFAQYLSDELVEELIADPSKVSLSGERRELSVLFSDIRGFTGFSEQMEPEELAGFLTAYLTPMTGAVRAHRGYVDKFIGDAVMALFGAPVHYPDHAAAACRAALAMVEAAEAVKPLAARHGIELAFGVGINTGEMVVGNMGSAERFDYTVVGDQVNLASRLEGLTKTYGVVCLVSGETRAAAGEGFTFRRVDRVRVKGRSEPVELWELCGGGGVVLREVRDPAAWARALDAWQRGEFPAARSAFAAFPDDPVARLYTARLAELGNTAPADWDGIVTHTRK